jgi:hypothetical protein
VDGGPGDSLVSLGGGPLLGAHIPGGGAIVVTSAAGGGGGGGGGGAGCSAAKMMALRASNAATVTMARPCATVGASADWGGGALAAGASGGGDERRPRCGVSGHWRAGILLCWLGIISLPTGNCLSRCLRSSGAGSRVRAVGLKWFHAILRKGVMAKSRKNIMRSFGEGVVAKFQELS